MAAAGQVGVGVGVGSGGSVGTPGPLPIRASKGRTLDGQVWAELGRLDPEAAWVREDPAQGSAFARAEGRRGRHRVFLHELGRLDPAGFQRFADAAVEGLAGAAGSERHTWILVGDQVSDGPGLRVRIDRFNREYWAHPEGAAPRVRLALVDRAWGVVVAPGALDGLPSLARMRLADAPSPSRPGR